MTDKTQIFIIVPALDEMATIGAVVSDLQKYTDKIVVVDDGSTDSTGEIARETGARVVAHEQTQGYDASLRDGFQYAVNNGADIIVTFDADGQHQAADVQRVVAPIQSGRSDIVVGRRPEPARPVERLFASYTSVRLGISDPLSGFKAYNVEVYRNVGYFDKYSSIGTHLMFAAMHRGYDLEEINIGIEEREDEPRFGHWRANVLMLRALVKIAVFDGRQTLVGR